MKSLHNVKKINVRKHQTNKIIEKIMAMKDR